jgi:cold shock CspA family protein
MSTVRFGTSTGTVTAFDQASGLGTIVAEELEVPFHCISIADGTRTIEVGAAVQFELLAKLGRYEAADIRPV